MDEVAKDVEKFMDEVAKDVEKFECRNKNDIEGIVPYTQDPFVAMVERLARIPDIDPTKLKQIMDMQERALDRGAKQAFNAAMTQAQNKIELVVAKSWNDQTKSHYAKLKSVLISAKPIYTKAGFSLMFYEGETDKENHKRVCVDIMHEQGHTEKRHADFAIQTTGIAGKTMMTLIHGQGSTFSYGRRYLTCMIFNIPTGDDDDGQTAGGKQPEIKYINEAQIKTIESLMIRTDINTKAFFKSLKIAEIKELPAKDFSNAMNILNARLKNMRQPGEEG
ncbi:MAG: ERF family protein [Deltaproteobacteria bacterium]|nr:ERF family protein [Deltaproteobacteria bacterium]